MSFQLSAQRQPCCLRWAGLSFFWLVSASWAQTPVPNAPVKPTSTEPVIVSLPATASTESGSQLVRKAESIIQQTGSTIQAMALYQTAAQAFHRTGEVEPEALAWHRVAQLSVKAGYPQQAKAAADKARTLLHLRTLPTRATTGLVRSQAARAYLTLGRIHIESGEVREAVAAYRTGLDTALAAKLPRESAAGYVALGRIAADGEDLDVAIRLTGISLEFWREAKDFSGEAMALNNLARFYERKGDLPLAAQLDEQAVQVTRFSRNHRAEGDSLNEAMRVHLMLGNHDAAAQACEQLIGLSRLRGEKKKESEQTITLAVIEAQRNHLPSAYRLLLRAFILGAENNKELAAQIKEFTRKLETAPKPVSVSAQREQMLAEAEFESRRGDYGAAYQLLLRALVMNDGKSDVLNVALNARIKTLAKQIEAQQKKPKSIRP